MFIFDAHLDLAMNAMEWNRDLRLSIADINQREAGLTDKPDRGNATVCFPELRRGNIGMVVATQIARYVALDNPLPGWHSPEQAWAHTQGQLAWYRAMEAAGELAQVTDLQGLEAQVAHWNDPTIAQAGKPIGYVLSLEGADSLVSVEHVEIAYQYGLRAIGPGHYGPGRFANGTNSTGKMGQLGIDLLKKMASLNIILDATHLCDDAFWQAMAHFDGPVWASHNNCRAIVDHNRQFSDEQIKELIGRKAVIGAVMDAWMIVPNWVRRQSTPVEMGLNLERVADHIDHICQLAGNAEHVGIGSDMDGAFGREQCPYDLTTISEMQSMAGVLRNRGYSETDVEGIMHGNWLRFLRRVWNR
jgi:membrane dipeptidase